MDDYVDELTRQIVRVNVDEPGQLAILITSLRFRHSHPWGRSVSRMLPQFDLGTGDALVCNEVVPHLHALEASGGSMRGGCVVGGSIVSRCLYMLAFGFKDVHI
eukprot:1837012-Pyramimonas_sp.AAC.1